MNKTRLENKNETHEHLHIVKVLHNVHFETTIDFEEEMRGIIFDPYPNMKTLLILLVISIPWTLCSQTTGDTVVIVEEQIICLCQEDAAFPGGHFYMQKFVQSNFRVPEIITYYDHPKKRVYIDFVVTMYGEIKDVRIVRGYSTEIDNEII